MTKKYYKGDCFVSGSFMGSILSSKFINGTLTDVPFQHGKCDILTCTERKHNAIYAKYSSFHPFHSVKVAPFSFEYFGMNELIDYNR